MAPAPSETPGRRGFRAGWVFAAIWLFYLGGNLGALVRHPPGMWRTVGLLALALFALTYILLVATMRRPRDVPGGYPGPELRVWLGLLTLLALALLQLPAAGESILTCAVYISAAAVMGLPLRHGLGVAVTVAIAVEAAIRFVPGWRASSQGYALAVVLAAAATWGMRLAFERQGRLIQAQNELAELAVADERSRIAGDLHDILGHSLTVVAVKAELAQRLLDVDLDRARAELRDLESLARDALADVRATALNMRGISLPGEIAAARAALAAANVEARLPGAADDVPTRNRELFAWTIREAVTNIVRHSRARHAEVRLSPDSVEIVDDGQGGDPAPGGGQGLAGLRRRADELGAHLIAGSRQNEPGFRVRVEVPS
ncbi:two-component system sensor histidine kinase DesK [Actinoplanes octamycinicus]|uniref:Two-component system sensor histidine kinase DesK n=1 Tax=Actinoplanes octamycinicus TaxID=135948 RepID=A0A7W7H2G8_9ACTN|nr:sensor histidine kinase [Actinoplanes octamycinicus]MBB4742604.1 two-component system sensor histidine kinase DesK [Actinoplanes octamycinicus]GIE60942.1 histidine kinase [Actinoplanes octamycinicus]